MTDVLGAAPDAPRLGTVLLTDLCDSVAVIEKLGDVAAAEMFRQHDSLVLVLQRQWKGRLIDRSDGLLLLFERPIDGVGFALDYMRGLRPLGTKYGVLLRARAGLHVGEVLTWHNSEEAVSVGAKPLEVEGLAKPMAARLMILARPGQILLTVVAETLSRRSARDMGERGERLLWKSHGRWRFKGVPTVQEVYEVGEIDHAPLRTPRPTAKAWRDLPLWRRPAALAAQIVVLAAIGVSAWLFTRPEPAIAFAERDWVVVGDLDNRTGNILLDDSLEQAFRISLEQSRYVNVLSDMKVRDTLSRMRRDPENTRLDRSVASEVALRDGVRAVILPRVSEVGGRLRIAAEVVDPSTQHTVYIQSAEGSGVGSALGLIDEVTAGLRGRFGEAIASIDRNSKPLPTVSTGNLDALRAYAVGQKAYGQGQFKQALGLYEHAVALDENFALAHLGMVRALNATEQLPKALLSLARVRAMSDRLPPREVLYLQAWQVQIDHPGEAHAKWRQMSDLYPDFHAAAANAGYALEMENRYSEGLPYIRRAAEARYEFAPLSQEGLGRMSLALGDYANAAAAFKSAADSGLVTAGVWQANLQAAQGDFAAAERAWPGDKHLPAQYYDRVSHYLDQGRWTGAAAEAQRLMDTTPAGSGRRRQGRVQLAVLQWLVANRDGALKNSRSIIDDALGVLETAPGLSARGEVALAAYAAILAQRLGDRGPAARVRSVMKRYPEAAGMQPAAGLLQVMEARELLASGRPEAAVEHLLSTLERHESLQLRVALMEAYEKAGDTEAALGQAEWVTSHRGWAYAEYGGCGWCGQSLNVADTTLARLIKAELLVRLGRADEARKELELFDRQWGTDGLPDYLRTRREGVLSTFN